MNRQKAIDVAFFLLRVVAGLLFMQAGGMKILDWFGGIPPAMGGHPAVGTQTWIGGILELSGGALILIGFLTRPAAFVLAGEMAVAYWQFHYKPGAFWPIQNMGQQAVLFCFIFLFMAARGGGPWSVDALVFGKRSTPEPASQV